MNHAIVTSRARSFSLSFLSHFVIRTCIVCVVEPCFFFRVCSFMACPWMLWRRRRRQVEICYEFFGSHLRGNLFGFCATERSWIFIALFSHLIGGRRELLQGGTRGVYTAKKNNKCTINVFLCVPKFLGCCVEDNAFAFLRGVRQQLSRLRRAPQKKRCEWWMIDGIGWRHVVEGRPKTGDDLLTSWTAMVLDKWNGYSFNTTPLESFFMAVWMNHFFFLLWSDLFFRGSVTWALLVQG